MGAWADDIAPSEEGEELPRRLLYGIIDKDTNAVLDDFSPAMHALCDVVDAARDEYVRITDGLVEAVKSGSNVAGAPFDLKNMAALAAFHDDSMKRFVMTMRGVLKLIVETGVRAVYENKDALERVSRMTGSPTSKSLCSRVKLLLRSPNENRRKIGDAARRLAGRAEEDFYMRVLCALYGAHREDEDDEAERRRWEEASVWTDAKMADALTADGVIENAGILSRRLASSGYSFVNIDDGFFHDRDEEGNLLVHPERFPDGMRHCLDSIRDFGLKTGIYSDAGRNTCGFYHSGDSSGRGCGLEDHEERDIELFLSSWGCDLLKVDWCGAWMRMNKRKRYTAIGEIVRRIKPGVIYSVCCWEWPGEWVTKIADSWRVGPDLEPTFGSVLGAIQKTRDLWKHASSTRFNDLDMMQLGHGMSPCEERTHFAMWCMLNSPVLLSCDLAEAPEDLFRLVTNRPLLRIHDDPLGRQAIMASDDGFCSVWKRALFDGSVAVAVMNSSDDTRTACVGTSLGRRVSAVDAWTGSRTDVGRSFSVSVAPRDTAVFLLGG